MRRLPRSVKWALGLAVAAVLIATGVFYSLYQTLPFMPSPDLTGIILKQAVSLPGPSAEPRAGNRGRSGGIRDRALVIAPRAGTQFALGGTAPGIRSAGTRARAAGTTTPDRPSLATETAAPGATTEVADLPAAGHLRHGAMQEGAIDSVILGRHRPYLVYLPPGYDVGQQHYPAVYLLHGAPGNYKDWKRVGGIDKTLDALISVGRLRPMIAVLPDGNGGFFGGDTEWANAGDHIVNAEDYVTDEVVPYIDLHYRTIADSAHRAVAGLSSGGFGAVNMTLHHPNLFGYALSLSGNYLAAATWTGKDLWGGDPAARRYNSPLLYAPTAHGIRGTHIFLAVGSSDNLDNTYRETVRFDAVLQSLEVPHVTRFFPGKHSWKFWREHIVDALEYLNRVMPS